MKTTRAPGPAPRPGHRYASAFAALLIAGCAMPALAEHLPHDTHDQYGGEVQIEILYPCDKSTVFDEDGKIQVEIAVLPSVKLSGGDQLELTLDGHQVLRRDGKQFVLEDLDHGPHYLRARMLDEHGHVVSHAEPVQFYTWPPTEFAASK